MSSVVAPCKPSLGVKPSSCEETENAECEELSEELLPVEHSLMLRHWRRLAALPNDAFFCFCSSSRRLWSCLLREARCFISLRCLRSLSCSVCNTPAKRVKSSVGDYRLAGLVVKASTSGAEDPGFESRLRRDFSLSSHTSDFKIGTSVATLPGAWHCRVSAGTGRPGVSIL